MPKLALLVVGQLEAELSLDDGWAAGVGAIEYATDPTAAIARLTGGECTPDVIVLAESRPGQFAATSIETLRRLAPLARIARVLGSWCEGETRSGKPPKGCTSTYWHQWPSRSAHEICAVALGRSSSWALPVTATPDERTLAMTGQPLAHGSGLIVIHAPHTQTAAALADVCRLGGYSPLIVTAGQRFSAPQAQAVLWDAARDQIVDSNLIDHLHTATAGAPIFALVSFPRVEDQRTAVDVGLAGLISKPYLIQDLLWHISRVRQALAA